MKPCETEWFKDARAVVKAFWDAREDYEYHKTRSCVGTANAERRMRDAVGELERLGVVWFGRKMPTLDEFEWGCGVRPVPTESLWVWKPKAGATPPWDVPAVAPVT